MGMLVEGQWVERSLAALSIDGEFVRESARLRDWVTPGGAPGPDGEPALAARDARWHLYVSLACPWAHCALLMRKLKGLESLIGVSVTSPLMLSEGWSYIEEEGSSGDPVNGVRYHRELYTLTDPDYTGRVTVPVLWDCHRGRIVNNESADLMRIFNSAFNELTGNTLDFYPPFLRTEIDALNELVYDRVNNGVYKTGFASEQAIYEKHFDALFDTLDELEALLSTRRYLTGAFLTEADLRLFTTLVRFDAVYYSHFKCNLRRIADYPCLSGYLRELFQWPQVAETVDMTHIKRHYYASHTHLNPDGLVPKGPALDFTRPHGRGHLPGRGVAVIGQASP